MTCDTAFFNLFWVRKARKWSTRPDWMGTLFAWGASFFAQAWLSSASFCGRRFQKLVD
eukprot:NODE_4905_length_630_cov_213.109565.p5 GENE.NODE_4905_length_630_cov_213.109565~~NODE_4905_length_630_cov_213.109565.p5  ORF type:complete len:58 (+),score=10.50 NODE_4905_length_630_cov_213.109565:255-428(+)